MVVAQLQYLERRKGIEDVRQLARQFIRREVTFKQNKTKKKSVRWSRRQDEEDVVTSTNSVCKFLS